MGRHQLIQHRLKAIKLIGVEMQIIGFVRFSCPPALGRIPPATDSSVLTSSDAWEPTSSSALPLAPSCFFSATLRVLNALEKLKHDRWSPQKNRRGIRIGIRPIMHRVNWWAFSDQAYCTVPHFSHILPQLGMEKFHFTWDICLYISQTGHLVNQHAFGFLSNRPRISKKRPMVKVEE